MRLRPNTWVKLLVLEDFTKMVHDLNAYVNTFNTLRKRVGNDAYPVPYQMVIHADKRPKREHQQIYNAPEASEVAAIIPGVQDNLIAYPKYITIQSRRVRNPKGNMVYSDINVSYRSYDTLGYPLLFP